MFACDFHFLLHSSTFVLFVISAPALKGSGECGALYVAHPLDACSPLSKIDSTVNVTCPPFVLIVRGGCSFEDKVRKAQAAGFKAAIIYDNVDGDLVASKGYGTLCDL